MEKLPVELRYEILSYLVPTGCNIHIINCYWEYRQARLMGFDHLGLDFWFLGHYPIVSIPLGLLTTSKQMMRDCCELLYGRNAFVFGEEKGLAAFLSAVSSQNLQRIKYVDIVVDRDELPSCSAQAFSASGFIRKINNLNLIQISGIGKGAHTRLRKPARTVFDTTLWNETDHGRINPIYRAPGSLCNGKVYCGKKRLSTVICRQEYPYTPTSDEVFVDMDDMRSSQKRWEKLNSARARKTDKQKIREDWRIRAYRRDYMRPRPESLAHRLRFRSAREMLKRR